MKSQFGSFSLMISAMTLCLTSAQPASAIKIWSYDNLVNPNNLITFDSTTPGNVTVVGSSGIPGGWFFSGLDFDNAGNLWGFTEHPTITLGGALYSINKLTGAATLVGPSGITDQTLDMSWNPVTKSMELLTYDGLNTCLQTVNLANGSATLIGTITGLPANTVGIGLATDSAGVNYLHSANSDSMYKLTGLSATLLGPEGFDAAPNSQGITIDWSRNGDWYHGAVRNTAPTLSVELYTVNPLTGAGTLVGFIGPGPLSYNTGDLAIEPVLVPEPAALALLSVAGLTLGGRIHTRRRAAV